MTRPTAPSSIASSPVASSLAAPSISTASISTRPAVGSSRFATTLIAALVSALFLSLIGASGSKPATAEDWPQFRGVNCSGRAATDKALPTEIAPDRNVAWKTALPPGHSSPVVVGDRIYLTGVRDERLVTIALDRATGKLLWEVVAPHEKLEQVHSIGSHAQSSPVADDERVISFFGSSGMFCYDRDGKLQWQHRMGPFNNDFGAASSPVLVGDKIVLCQDHDTDSFLMALDKRTGKIAWKTDRREFPRNFCSPVVWDNDGKKQIVIAATLRVAGYDLETGLESWTVRGISRTVCMTPVVGDDNILYVAGWAAGGDKEEPIRVGPFAEALEKLDLNKNGTLEENELGDSPFKQRFTQVDRDNDDRLSREEYEFFRSLFEQGRNLVLAIKPGAKGDASATSVLWTHDRFVPFCASPLYYRNLVFTVKDGGIVTCLDAKSGKSLKSGRLPNTGSYYASPVAGDGKVFMLNQDGKLSVLAATGDWKVVHSADFAEDCYATPALVDGRVYLRTAGFLYCFGAASK